MPKLPTVLFFGESASLSHVVRPLMLASSLDPSRYNVVFAASASAMSPIPTNDTMITFRDIYSADRSTFLQHADRGEFALGRDVLKKYIEDERRLIEELCPSLVVSDLRFTVAINAEAFDIQHVAISNLYWSPYRRLRFDPVPGFVKERPLSERYSATAIINEIRSSLALPLISGYRDLVTRGTFTAYADPPGLVETDALPESHVIVGPILWEPSATRSDWLPETFERPLIYVNLGSSGTLSALFKILHGLAPIGGTIILATAGRAAPARPVPNVRVVDFVPGSEVSRLADLVVCNGGPASQQALRGGTPMLGLWGNIDQYLSANVIQSLGAGLAMEARRASSETVVRAARCLLDDARYRNAAAALAPTIDAIDPAHAFPALVERALGD